ncbi:MAG TPA: DUF692 domain-containing protein [Sandaracinaceae bacterium LLY-WYZ-13_1]|nr:DUF692 domain-containing protein [Sandaracinaceae bacterium LLY-WYZ-13_1]
MTDIPPAEGVGLGLRHDLAKELFERAPEEVRWLEIHPENYVARGGGFALNLERAMDRWAIVPHGLTLCFGTTSPFDRDYTRELKALLDRVDAPWYSDHLCFAGVDGVYLHDLLPLPFTEESVRTAAARVRELQDAIERPVAIENVSFYADPAERGGWDEADFLLEVLDAADCKLLLDVNNVYVNSINHGFDPKPYIDRIPPERVVQMHVAGHMTRKDGIIIDTHGEPMCEGVFELLEHTLERMGPTPVLLERDQNIPPLDEILEEVRRLSAIYDRAIGRWEARRTAPIEERVAE